jgi:hypothetical protein
MSKSSEMARSQKEQEYHDDPFPPEQEQQKPDEIMILPGAILTLSKSNAEQFHQQMRQMILNTGYGAFEYLEAVNFFIKVKDYISGNKQAKIPEDAELKSFIREEIAKHPKGKLVTNRGVIFELAETGTAYDFSLCQDAVLDQFQADYDALAEKLKARKEFLKTVPIEGLTVVDTDTGEASQIFPPSKSSNSSYKVSLPK